MRDARFRPVGIHDATAAANLEVFVGSLENLPPIRHHCQDQREEEGVELAVGNLWRVQHVVAVRVQVQRLAQFGGKGGRLSHRSRHRGSEVQADILHLKR